MSFHKSCDLVRIEVRGDGTWLLAAAGNGHGENIPSQLRLDDHIGNSDGYFSWQGHRFTQTAKNIQLSFRNDGVWLEADISEVNGGERGRQGINLSDHIENRGGKLVFVGL
ncbi:Cyanovirin-N [Penicillium brevicompactum]|uniref:Cyanovirin-N n=1 Tax=Penicillium brevicompactum TaxID=5074 RepID=UPI0025420450|nr:Cyanovirin-N [Penicillium brevicompactum]KAJ5348223.1 Cyanovirin-N [Penicillium brevicompactum]